MTEKAKQQQKERILIRYRYYLELYLEAYRNGDWVEIDKAFARLSGFQQGVYSMCRGRQYSMWNKLFNEEFNARWENRWQR